MAPFVTLAELAHRSAYAPAGPGGGMRFTAVGDHRTCRRARSMARHRLAVFHALEEVGPAGAVTDFGARVLAGLGLPLPPRTSDLALLRAAVGADDPEAGRIYVTPWLTLPAAPPTPARALQLTLFPALSPSYRDCGSKHRRSRHSPQETK